MSDERQAAIETTAGKHRGDAHHTGGAGSSAALSGAAVGCPGSATGGRPDFAGQVSGRPMPAHGQFPALWAMDPGGQYSQCGRRARNATNAGHRGLLQRADPDPPGREVDRSKCILGTFIGLRSGLPPIRRKKSHFQIPLRPTWRVCSMTLEWWPNCALCREEFQVAFEQARRLGIPLHAAEATTLGLTHCDSGKIVAEKWHLSADLVAVAGCHHDPRSATNTVNWWRWFP